MPLQFRKGTTFVHQDRDIVGIDLQRAVIP